MKQGDLLGPVLFSFTLTSSQLEVKPQQSAYVFVAITIKFDEVLGVFGTHYPKTASVPTFQLKLTNPSPATTTSTVANSTETTSSTFSILSLGATIWAIWGFVSNVRGLPFRDSEGRFHDSSGRFVSRSTVISAFGSFGLSFAIVGVAFLGQGFLSNVIGLVGSTWLGQPSLGSSLYIIGLSVTGFVLNRH